jgi:hypothetical protein
MGNASGDNYCLISLNGKNGRPAEIKKSFFDKFEEIEKRHGKQLITEHDKKNRRFDYFAEYLHHIDVKTVIIEFDYRDKQYIEDHSNYYSRSFRHYSRRCLRLHFFSASFEKDEFDELLKHFNLHVNDPKGENHQKIYDSYRGFTTFKPLPFTIFGKTCLATYEKEKSNPKGQRYFDTVREYEIHLFGITYKINSVAYQEQDNQIFVCATTALWVAFQCTSYLFDHKIPTPYEITRQATGRNTVGNEGLSNKEMVKAISEQKLHSITVKSNTTSHAKAILYAYLKGQIPVIMGVKVVSSKKNDEDVDRHAITILGFDLIDKKATAFIRDGNNNTKRKDLYLKSSLIEKIYAHDDQTGAFTRMKFDKNEKEVSFSFKDFKKGDVYKMELMIFPLYHKIRIPFKKILEVIDEFNTYVFPIKSNYETDYKWDIYLTTTCRLKKDLRERKNDFIDRDLYENILLKILTVSLPRFIWVANAYENYNDKDAAFSLYFDATDMENSDFFLFYLPKNEIIYMDLFYSLFRASTEKKSKYNLAHNFSSYQIKQIFNHLIYETTTKENTIGEIIESLLFEGVKNITDKDLNQLRNKEMKKIPVPEVRS